MNLKVPSDILLKKKKDTIFKKGLTGSAFDFLQVDERRIAEKNYLVEISKGLSTFSFM